MTHKAKNFKVYHDGKQICTLGEYSIAAPAVTDSTFADMAFFSVTGRIKDWQLTMPKGWFSPTEMKVTLTRPWRHRLFSWPWRPWHPYLIAKGTMRALPEEGHLEVVGLERVRTARRKA